MTSTAATLNSNTLKSNSSIGSSSSSSGNSASSTPSTFGGNGGANLLVNTPHATKPSNYASRSVVAAAQQPNGAATASQPAASNNEDYLNKKIAFIQNHINNLLTEITNLTEPWTYAVTEDGRVFFIK
jgi:hypothetical protein